MTPDQRYELFVDWLIRSQSGQVERDVVESTLRALVDAAGPTFDKLFSDLKTEHVAKLESIKAAITTQALEIEAKLAELASAEVVK